MIMKKIFIVFGLLAFFVHGPNVEAQSITYNTKIDYVVNSRNIAITHPETEEKFLLQIGSGCRDLRDNQSIKLTLNGTLNGAGDDIVQLSSIHRCNILKADTYTHRLYLNYTFRSNTIARVIDNQEREFNIFYPGQCSAIRRYRKEHIYLTQGSDKVSTGDQLILPDNEGRCSLSFVREIGESPFNGSNSSDSNQNKRPTQVKEVKAFPQNGSAVLDWKAATDDKKVDFYWVAISRSPINTRDLTADGFSEKIKATTNRIVIPDLQNDRPYYFYVIAVDEQGLTSSEWSIEASATPKSSIRTPVFPNEIIKLDLEIIQESESFFTLKWNQIPQAHRALIFLEKDGEREWAKSSYWRQNIRIRKHILRKGAQLKFTVQLLGSNGIVDQESVEFDF